MSDFRHQPLLDAAELRALTPAKETRPELLDLPHQLAGDRVLLRPYRPGDGAEFFAAIDRHRDELKTFLGWIDQHQTPADSEAYARRFHAKWHDRSSLIFGIWSADGAEFFGGTGFHGLDWSVPSFEIGYFLHPGARGRGHGAEAVALVTKFGFESLGARRIWASCDALNARSVRLLERSGYTREALLRNHGRTHHGNLRDTLIYAVTELV